MSSGLNRDTTDKFYTEPRISLQCIELFREEIKVSENDILLEPSAGDGSFIPALSSIHTNRRLFYDLYPEHESVIRQDYLQLSPKQFVNEVVHVIGNPPFGRQSSMAIKFIRHSATFAKTISFILPKSFKKISFQSKFPTCFHLVKEFDLPENSFLLNSKPHNVPCVFQIWERREVDREPEQKHTPLGYRFVKKHETPHLSFRRVGVNAGTVSRDIENKSEQSRYFLVFDELSDLEKILTTSLTFDSRDNTVGPRSISKAELIQVFNEAISKVIH
jgi:hypothetical protein